MLPNTSTTTTAIYTLPTPDLRPAIPNNHSSPLFLLQSVQPFLLEAAGGDDDNYDDTDDLDHDNDNDNDNEDDNDNDDDHDDDTDNVDDDGK